MTRDFVNNSPRRGGICRACSHDLIVRDDGHVYCSNKPCNYHDEPHPTGKSLNLPRGVASE